MMIEPVVTMDQLASFVLEAFKGKTSSLMDHSLQVADVAAELARVFDCDAEKMYLAGVLHDVGKLHIPEAILTAPRELTPKEWEIVRMHPIWGSSILQRVGVEPFYVEIAKLHHEAVGGKGYPFGLKLEELPLEVQIIHIADRFCALTENRAYRLKYPVEVALKLLRRDIETLFKDKASAVIECLVAATEKTVTPCT